MTEPEIPEALNIRSSNVVSALFFLATAVNLGIFFVNLAPLSLGLTVMWGFIAFSTTSWEARITPSGVSYTNRIGQDWAHAWSELQVVKVGHGGGGQPWLIALNTDTGNRVRVNGGAVRSQTGQTVKAGTTRTMIQAWAVAGTASSPPTADQP